MAYSTYILCENGECCQPRAWFKGADTYAVLKYLEDKYEHLEACGWEVYRSCILQAIKCANMFLSTLYKSPLWLKPAVASVVVNAGLSFCLHYRECSEFAFRENKTRFKLPPKFHAYVHIVHALLFQLGKLEDSMLNSDQPAVLNPLSQSCQMDEDMVGHIASLSRASVQNSVHEKTIGMYLMNLQAKW